MIGNKIIIKYWNLWVSQQIEGKNKNKNESSK